MASSEYDISSAFEEIENELIASMIRNMDRHRAEETKEGILWSQWQVEQLAALERYKRDNQKKYGTKFKSINRKIEEMIRQARDTGNMEQEEEILEAIKKGFSAHKLDDGITGAFFKVNDRKLDALIRATTNDMQTAETAILRMANDQYRSAIYNAQVYANTGAGTYAKAVDMATKAMLAAGLNCVEYANGARHKLSDYADMALRTASKRAKLTGEGEMRQAWGINTVIVNKRGNPCPQCLPFCGKVLVDDVWSGGGKDGKSNATGIKYPLMSKAVAAGLYHPRCRDLHTTYYEGISTPPEGSKRTKEELRELEEQYYQEQKLRYAQHEAKKYERLSEYSLDPENKRRYGTRAAEWAGRAEQGTQKMQPAFVPAKTIEEAEEYIKQYVDSGQFGALGVSYSGVDVEVANEINKTFSKFFSEFNVGKFGGIVAPAGNTKLGKLIDGATAAYSPVRNSFLVNRKSMKNMKVAQKAFEAEKRAIENLLNHPEEYDFSKLPKRVLRVVERSKVSGRATVPTSIEESLWHEMGHMLEKQVFSSPSWDEAMTNMSSFADKISGYAGESKSEYVAESFAAYLKGERNVDPILVGIFEKLKR